MKELLDIIFPTLSDELIIVISLIIGLLVTAFYLLGRSESAQHQGFARGRTLGGQRRRPLFTASA